MESARQFMNAFLAGQLQFQFQPPSSSIPQVRHLFFESKNRERLYGSTGLGFGFPMLLSENEGQLKDTTSVDLEPGNGTCRYKTRRVGFASCNSESSTGKPNIAARVHRRRQIVCSSRTRFGQKVDYGRLSGKTADRYRI